MSLPAFLMDTPLHPSFEKDIRDTHLIYDYDAQDPNGNPEKWRYEMWFFSENRIVYAIHGGPMAGRINYQTCQYQCIRPGELWQCSWLEYVQIFLCVPIHPTLYPSSHAVGINIFLPLPLLYAHRL